MPDLPPRYQTEQRLPGSLASYRAFDQELQQAVFVKTLSLQALKDWKDLELFEREIQTLQHLEHPQIPRFLSTFKTGDQYVLVTEWVEGEPLSDWLSTHAPISEHLALDFAQQLLGILDYLHSFKPPVIHRDINPANLRITPDKKLILVDFGAVKNRALTQHTTVGTFGYMAPEQLGGQVKPQADLYAVGVTLIEALSGVSPTAMPRKGLKLKFHPLIKVSSGLAFWLEILVSPKTDERFKTAKDALEELAAFTKKSERKLPTLPTGSRLVIQQSPQTLEIACRAIHVSGTLKAHFYAMGLGIASGGLGFFPLIFLMMINELSGHHIQALYDLESFLDRGYRMFFICLVVGVLAYISLLIMGVRANRKALFKLSEKNLRVVRGRKIWVFPLAELKSLTYKRAFLSLKIKSESQKKSLRLRLKPEEKVALYDVIREHMRDHVTLDQFQEVKFD